MISVIIPVLNESVAIEATLKALTENESADIEVIVVDGASEDDTIELAQRFTSDIITAPRGRASQMNTGAEAARGDILFFMHADCQPPDDFHELIQNTLETPGVIAGAFDLSIDQRGMAYRIIESIANLRSRLSGVPYGDQGFFIYKRTFDRLAGFKEIPLMEDIEIGRRLKQIGRIAILKQAISTSPRRWLREGLVYTTLRDGALALAYTVLGVSPEKLAKYYRQAR